MFGDVHIRKGEYRVTGMAHALRHAPSDYGITLNDDGTVLVDVLAAGLNASVDAVLNTVATDTKGRYELVYRGDDVLVRAVHGHSVPVNLPMDVVNDAGTLFHGTKVRFLDSILSTGLHKGSRNHVHLSRSMDVAVQVASRRKGDTVVLLIDTAGLVNDGGTVYRSASGIYLTDAVPAHYITELFYL